MLFVELTPFIAFRAEHWTDDELRELQNYLLENPAAGEVIRGSAGLRKLRWAASGRGKRGGARVIYYHYLTAHLPDLRLHQKRSRRPYTRTAQALGPTHEEHHPWISNISTNWSRASAR